MRSLWFGLGLASAVGCSSGPAPTHDTDGSPRVDALAPVRAFAGYARFGSGAPAAMHVALPTHANAPLTIGLRDRAGFSLAIGAEGLRPIVARAREGARLYADAAPETDLAIGGDATGVEDLRILRSARAPRTFRWRLHGGPEVAAIRVREGRIEAVDAKGRVGLGTGVVRAVDADGRAVDLALSLAFQGETARDARDARDVVVEARLEASDLRYPVLVDPGWSTVPSMAHPRARHGSILLDDGRALIVGGFTYNYATLDSGAELYDPATNAFSFAGNMQGVRMDPMLAKGVAGEVLAIGGADANTDGSALVESWSVTTKAWSPRPLLSTFRNFGTATKLADGRVLVAGGLSQYDQNALTTAEIYDPVAKKWTPAGNLSGSRAFHTAWALADGRVLVAGGARRWTLVPRYSPEGGSELSSAEIYDPATNTWGITGALSSARWVAGCSPGRVANGRPIFVGGATAFGSVVSTIDAFDPAAGKWSIAATLTAPRAPLVVAYAGGSFLAAGAEVFVPSSKLADLCDVATGLCAATDSMVLARAEASATPLLDGTVLVTGGLPNIVSTSGGNVPYASAEIFGRKPSGATCAAGADCVTGQCVDGVCCDTACTESCRACDVAGSLGTCAPVTGAPHASRSCAPYLACAAGSCATSCALDANCAATHFCASNACVPKKAQATTCGGDHECASGHCVDGVCCDAACDGQCAACDLPGHAGTCTATTGAPRGGRAACAGVGVGTTCGSTCDGVDFKACHYPLGSTPCGKNTCASGVETHLSLCDGAGSCSDVPRGCAAYACDATACRNTCVTAAHCAAGYVCFKGACVPSGDLGEACSPSKGCSAGLFCTDGVCCGTASCPGGSACNAVGHEGACTKSRGTACAADAECGGGHCVDAVCCESSCGGQCEACDVPGKLGLCMPVSGAPHGTRAACDAGAGDLCKAAACDGTKDTTRCAGFANGPSVECGKASCAVATATAAGRCDGFGSCHAGDTRTCAPYACGETACRTSCTVNTDCAAGNQCVGGACVPGNRCSDDGLASVDPSGNRSECGVYRCRADGNCGTICTATTECAPGATCDGGKCVTSAVETPSSGGCAVGGESAPGAMGVSGGLAAALAVLGARRARRRARANRSSNSR